MSASDLEAILEDALRDRGHPTPMLEAQKLCFHLSRIAGGETVRIPAYLARVADRTKQAEGMRNLPLATVAERVGCSKSTAWRDRQRLFQNVVERDTAPEETVPPKEPHGGGD